MTKTTLTTKLGYVIRHHVEKRPGRFISLAIEELAEAELVKKMDILIREFCHDNGYELLRSSTPETAAMPYLPTLRLPIRATPPRQDT